MVLEDNSHKKDILLPLVGLDIGTTKVSVVVGECDANNELEIIGVGNHPSHGLKRGVVVNIEKTVNSIQNAVEKAEHMSGYEIKEVIVGIAGGHIKGMNGYGMVTLRDKEVTTNDIERVIESANALLIPAEREIIHAIPQNYTVDRESGIKDPLGIHGLKLEADVHIVTGDVTSARNIIKCIEMSGMTSADMVIEQIASSEAVLTQDEREIGVAMIDFGGGTCDIAVFMNGSVKYTESITLGGDHLDRDIAFGFSVSLPDARKLKENHGVAMMMQDEMPSDEKIEVTSASGHSPRRITKRDLAMIIQMRMEEIFMLVKKEFLKQGFIGMLPAGVVLTGGGSKMRDMTALAEMVLEMPVRIGIPRDVNGLTDIITDPIYSTGVGLIKYASVNRELGVSGGGLTQKNVFTRMKGWFNEFF
ncbi:MAG: cell division protein FtsA [Candidatus Dadabacteria bacterium]|nr:cell division protein FtsA [Candidatus Dadabacteria bacterium]